MPFTMMLYIDLDLVGFVSPLAGFDFLGTNPTFDISFLLYVSLVAIT